MLVNRIKLLIRGTGASLSLIYRSSGLLILLYFLISLFSSTLSLASTFSLKYIIDSVTAERVMLQTVFLTIDIYISVSLLTLANQRLDHTVFDVIFKKAAQLYECDMMKKVEALPLSRIDSAKGRNEIDEVRYTKTGLVWFSRRLIKLISLAYTFIVAFISIFSFNIPFALLFMLLTVPGTVFQLISDEKTDDQRRKKAPDVRKFCYYRWMLTDPYPAKDVRMYDLTDPIKERYDEVKDEYVEANKRLDKSKLAFLMISELILRAGEIIFTVFVVYKAFLGDISIGDIALYTGLALSAISSCGSFSYMFFYSLFRSTENIGHALDFFSSKEENKGGTRELGKFETLEFQNVHFTYPNTSKEILKGVSFTLKRGDKLSLVGINGSGKSTIIKLMMGLYEISSGEILINGYPMEEYDIRKIRRRFGALFQSFVHCPLTLRENIALSDLKRIDNDDEINEALKKSGIYGELQPKLTEGLSSFMSRRFDDKGTELSKGQWQKLALSRAYFKNADILIFDEPSAALDAEAEDRIFKNFEDISEGKTGIMISHRISAARMCDKIIVLSEGVVAEEGTHGELVEKGGLYAKLYNLQKEKYTGEVTA